MSTPNVVQFTVPGPPVAKGRPRAFSRGRGIALRTPKKTERYEGKVASFARSAFEGEVMSGGVAVVMEFVLPRPKRIPKRTPGRLPAPVKPDLDNLVKAVLDGVEKAGAFEVGDGQVVSIMTSKWYAALGEEPCVEVQFSWS